MFLYHVAHAVFPAVFVLHAGYRYGWGPGMVGASLAAFGLYVAVVQGALVKPSVNAYGERKVLIFGMLAGILGLLLLAIASTGLMFWLAMPVMALWGFIGPAAQGLMTRLVEPELQGQLQGAGASLMGIGSLVGPTLFTATFALGIKSEWGAPLPGAPYMVAALLLCIALAMALHATRIGATDPIGEGRVS